MHNHGKETSSWAFISIVLAAAMLVTGVLWWTAFTRNWWWALLAQIPLILAGYHWRHKLNIVLKGVAIGLMIGVFIVSGTRLLIVMRDNIETPPEWDFELFWLFGRASALGLNPYQQENLLSLAEPLNPSDFLVAELYYFHAPPTLFLFAPLGWFEDIHAAYAVWYGFHVLMMALSIRLMWRIFMADGNRMGLLLVATLVCVFSSTTDNFILGQVNFLLLALLLLFQRDYPSPRAGLWIGLGIMVKPILLFIPLFLLLRRQWKVIGTLIGTLGILSILTILVYGAEMFFMFFTNNTIANNMPNYLYTEIGNQSLLGAILRLMQFDFSRGSPYFQPLLIVAAGLVTLITGWYLYRLGTAYDDWGISLTIAFALVIFPKTLWHYSVLLLIPIGLFWHKRSSLPGMVWAVGSVIFLLFILVYYESGTYSIFANLLAWSSLIGVSWWVSRQSSASMV